MEEHAPVLLAEVLEIFKRELCVDGEFLFVDATLGGGGHARAILSEFKSSSLVGFDRDATARRMAGEKLDQFGERSTIIAANFSSLSMETVGRKADAVLFDLGVSNMQLTEPARGFSFSHEGPLDMRMDPSEDRTAEDLLASADLRELTRIFSDLGEERHSFRIAQGIIRARERGELPATTTGLAALIREILPAPVQRKMGTHPARRIFQALRIEVNGELESLREGLIGASEVCGAGAIIQVISYHSLEDRIVKHFFKDLALRGHGRMITKKPILPSDQEIERNPKSRSAKLRAFIVDRSVERRC